MKNYELYSLECPDDHAKRLVSNYALREVLDNCKSYTNERFLAAQLRVYDEWLTAVRKTKSDFTCCFHEWLLREGDSAFIFRPGDLVKYNGCYCVVTGRNTYGMGWENKWRIVDNVLRNTDWPQLLTTLEIKEADGHICCINGLDNRLEPADIPPEVFALACGRAKNCPILKGEHNGK